MSKQTFDLLNIHTVQALPSGKLPFDCQKIAKNLTFYPPKIAKIAKIFHFFKKIADGNFFEKMKNVGNFLTFKWQFSGGSAR